MKRILGCLVAVWALSLTSEAQLSKYIIKFRDKGSNSFSFSNPAAYLSQKAIDRRTRYSIAIDSSDLPVTVRYLDSIRLSGTVTILNVSKWLNAVSIQTTDAAALAKIRTFPFVQVVSGIALRTTSAISGGDKFEKEKEQLPVQLKETGVTADFFNYGQSFDQVHLHNGEFLHNIGLRGQNMVIGMLDAGFNNYVTVKAFDSVRANGQILGIYDFVARDSSVNEDNQHGMQCFSIIAANVPGQFIGTAPKANFYLFRTEDASSEYPVEEFNWVCGAERVDSVGGDVISSSLGYGDKMTDPAFNHSYTEMNGNTTMAAIGADLAAKKGILVVNAAGNEGTNTWKYIITPADGDSVMAVGAVTTKGAVVNFSSYGPSSDGQVKPDVASVGAGTIIQYPNNSIGGGNGTSFACPNMAGLTTCLWQGFPEFNNMKIINALRQSGSKASTPDDRIGYGIPDVRKALANLLKEFAVASASVANCTATVEWTSKDVSAMKYEIERKLPGQNSFIKIAERNGAGNAFGTRPAYQHQDVLSGVAPGMITYRIRQVVDTSVAGLTAVYIDTVSVNLVTGCVDANLIDVTLAPNPVRDNVSVRVTTPNASSSIMIRVFNSSGQLMISLNKSKLAGTAYFDNISLIRFAKGKYYVNVYDNNKLLATKELIKL